MKANRAELKWNRLHAYVHSWQLSQGFSVQSNHPVFNDLSEEREESDKTLESIQKSLRG